MPSASATISHPRRMVLGVAASALGVLFRPTSAVPAGQDAKLLALIAEAETIDASGDAAFASVSSRVGGDSPSWLHHVEVEVPRWHELLDEIARTPARTRAGLSAKARIARSAMVPGETVAPSGENRVAYSLCGDLLAIS